LEYSNFLQPNSFYADLPAYEDGTECSETSVYKIHTPGTGECWSNPPFSNLNRSTQIYLPMKMEQSVPSAYKIQTPGNYPEEKTHKT
jgi:hypothetical protein